MAIKVPAWSIVNSAYLFRDASHRRPFFNSGPGQDMKKVAEDKLGTRILGPTYFGARQIGLTSSKEHRHQHRLRSAFAEIAGGGRFYGLR